MTKKNFSGVRIGSPIRNRMQQIVDSQATNPSTRANVPKEVPCLNTSDALLDNIMYKINPTTSKLLLLIKK